MAKNSELGIYQQKNGLWMYRYTITVDGKKQEHKGTRDVFGNPLRTKKEAIKARDESRESLNRSRM